MDDMKDRPRRAGWVPLVALSTLAAVGLSAGIIIRMTTAEESGARQEAFFPRNSKFELRQPAPEKTPDAEDRTLRPRAVLLAHGETTGVIAKQRGVLIHLDAASDGEIVTILDRSRPPVPWPPAMTVAGGRVRLRLFTSAPPIGPFEVRVWEQLRGNGLPKDAPRVVTCRVRPNDEKHGCQLTPDREDSPSWWEADISLQGDESSYLSASGTWTQLDSHGGLVGFYTVAWAFHVNS